MKKNIQTKYDLKEYKFKCHHDHNNTWHVFYWSFGLDPLSVLDQYFKETENFSLLDEADLEITSKHIKAHWKERPYRDRRVDMFKYEEVH